MFKFMVCEFPSTGSPQIRKRDPPADSPVWSKFLKNRESLIFCEIVYFLSLVEGSGLPNISFS